MYITHLQARAEIAIGEGIKQLINPALDAQKIGRLCSQITIDQHKYVPFLRGSLICKQQKNIGNGNQLLNSLAGSKN
jgi:hypothetical protein